MSINNRILANMWRMANVDGNQNPTGLKNITTGAGVPPTTAIVAWPAFYVNTTTKEVYYTVSGPTPTWLLINGTNNGLVGPATSTVGNLPTFNNTTGTLVADSGKSLPSGTVVGTTDTQTLSNKTLSAPNLTGVVQFGGNTGSAAQVLTSNGSSTAPSWQTIAAGGGGNSGGFSIAGVGG